MADQSKNNVDKALEALNLGLEIEPTGTEVEIDKGVAFDPQFELQDDGSALIPEDPMMQQSTQHDDNLAEFIEEDELRRLTSDLINYYESDKDTRKDWEDTYVKGLDMLGFKYEDRTQPFEGASGVVHPLLAESVTQFQAQAYKEMLPPHGPVNCQIVGQITPQVEDQAQRVKDFMNYQIMNVMKEYDPELDQLLFYLPLAGSAFKKVYYDGQLGRAVSKFVSGEDLIIDYYATDLATASRVTHCIKMSGNELRKNQVSGFYRDVEIDSGSVEPSDSQDKVNELDGVQPSYTGDDDEHLILEMHCDLDLPGFEDKDGIKLPYIVTLDKHSEEILSIRRNFDQIDASRKKKQYFVHYKFLPGLGFYGFGLIHMLGGLSRTATSVLRQLIDAGTLANLPAGFKARGMRIRDHDNPLQPGEFRDVDVTGTSIKESLLPLPYKEPSGTLFQLLGFAVDAGKSFAAIADMKMGEGNEQNPVGTTLALLERGTKVMSAIHKRLHYAQKTEFNLLASVFQSYLPPEYPYQVIGGNQMIKQQDFDDRVDIIPVSDPNIFSMSQRIMLAQQQLQLAQASPQLHNLREAYRRMYLAMGVDNVDAILKPDPNVPKPMSPAMENALAMRGTQPKAFPQQNHMEHMKTHADFIATRMVQINPQLYAMMESHILEHIALMAAEQVEQEMSKENQQMAAMIEQAKQNPQVAQQAEAAQKQFMMQKESRIATVESAMVKEMLEEEKRRVKEVEDPLIKLKQQEIDLRAAETIMKQQSEAQKTDIDRDKLEIDAGLELMKTESDRQSREKEAALKRNMDLIREQAKRNDR